MSFQSIVACPADVVALAELHYLSHTVSFAPFASQEWVESRVLAEYEERWRGSLARAETEARARVWKVVVGGAVIGTVGIFPMSGCEAQLTNMHVRPDFHRRGIGSMLMNTAEAFLGEAGFETAILGVIQANTAARTLYERHGWQVDELKPTGVEGVPIAIYRLDL